MFLHCIKVNNKNKEKKQSFKKIILYMAACIKSKCKKIFK